MSPTDTLSQIKIIMEKMIQTGLSNAQNYPYLKKVGAGESEIGISGAPVLSISMKDAPYGEIYRQLDQGRAYHIRMIDGALLQMCYRFVGRVPVEHRLCVFPSPILDNYDSDPAPYENDELFADIIGRGIVHVPIRFDFNADTAKHIDVKHPKSHLTLGQYPNCRIPVDAPLTPARFVKFVLRNFYFTAFEGANLDKIDATHKFSESLSKNEKKLTHVVC